MAFMTMRFVLFSLTAILAFQLCSADDSGNDQSASTGAVAADATNQTLVVDRYHEELSHELQKYVHRFDYFLSPSHTEENTPGSWIKVQPKIELEEGEGLSLGGSFKAKIKVPHLTKNLEVMADNIPGTLLPGKDLPEISKNVNAALRLKVFQNDYSWINFDAGLNFQPMPAPFTRIILSHSFKMGDDWRTYLTQQGFWYNHDDGFGEMSEVDFEWSFLTNSLFRSTSAGTWSEETDGWEWEQTLLLGKVLEPWKRSFAVRFSLFGHKSSAGVMDEYRANATYRWNAFRHWLFFNITPQISFHRDHDFKFTPLIRFSVEIIFGDKYYKEYTTLF